MICFAGNSSSSIVLTLILSVVTPNLSLNTYARASIVRFSEPVVIVAIKTTERKCAKFQDQGISRLKVKRKRKL